jgi:hypothetical protein
MEDLIDQKAKEWAGTPEALEVIKEARNEIEIFRKYSSYYSYAFFVMRRPVA